MHPKALGERRDVARRAQAANVTQVKQLDAGLQALDSAIASPVVKEEQAPQVLEVSVEHAREELKNYVDKVSQEMQSEDAGLDAALSLLKQFNCTRVTDLKDEQRVELVAILKDREV